MAKITYKEVCSIGTGLILSGTFFIIGLIVAQFPYDLPLLFDPNVTQEHFDNALKHYQNLFYTPKYVMGIYIGLYCIGMLGCLIRIYKPHPDLQMFEYGTLVLYFLTICIFLTNVKTGIDSCHYRQWGDITENQGLAVMGSSNIIILVLILGILILQAGLWWTNWDYQNRLTEFFAEEAEVETASKQATNNKPSAAKAKENKKQK